VLGNLAAADDFANGDTDLVSPAQRIPLAHDAPLNVLEVLLSGVEQLIPLTSAFLSESVVLADDEALTGEQLLAFDLGKIAIGNGKWERA